MHIFCRCQRYFVMFFIASGFPGAASAQLRSVPRMQAEPQPQDQVSLQRDGIEITRYHFGSALRRPFLFPLAGPSGRFLTRMGHPHDPVSHSHHNSVWIAHHDVNGVDFWGDQGKGRIVHQKIEKLTDSDQQASITVLNAWRDEAAKKTLMTERRTMIVQPLEKGEWLLILDIEFQAHDKVTLGKTPFGLVGVRMAKSIGVNDGGGRILNSDGKINEKEVFRKPAKWVDYSGAIRAQVVEGIQLMDHPDNPNHPSVFHVRNDGWMGAALTFDGPRRIEPGQTLRLRYGLYVHAGLMDVAALQERWAVFARTSLADPTPDEKKK